jgi:hypothetical protein
MKQVSTFYLSRSEIEIDRSSLILFTYFFTQRATLFVIMIMNQSFFLFLLPKVLNTSIVISSLSVYSTNKSGYDQLFILFGTMSGLIIDAILLSTNIKMKEEMKLVQTVLNALITLFTTMIGFYMLEIRKKQRSKNVTSRFILLLLPICIILNQGLETQMYLMKHKVNNTSFLFYSQTL